ncbi:hypothetical protein AXG93_1154s1340 [Marchantia polymorpha subsp. ruderalis]|uniref:RNA polymerase sigma-70 region 4 domain-containing protein n=1 Tax=Marchantia polymorpha subsp. ruderalis TaxID=1480154 RepID=A0A176WRD7_MARPO|nr:hypothetical protein AXG93_1154s1340 [Marchantia polymorpha subsp. ruderalis]
MEAMVSVQFVKFASFSSAFWSSEPYTRGYVRAASRTRFPGTSLAVVQKAESGRRTGSSSHVDVTESSERVNAQGSRKFDRVSAHAIDEDDSTPVKGSSHWPRIEGASNPLTSEEESVLAAEVQDLVQLQRQRDELEAKLGRTPSVEEWADFVGSSVFRLYARTVYETASLVLRHKEEFQSSHGREPTLQELADLSLVDKDTIRNTMRLVRPAKSLEQMVSTVDGEYEKQVADPDRSVRPWFHLRDEDMKMDINNALHSLSSREQEVLEMRYGLDGKRPLSRAEVASLMNLSYETIRLTEKKALGKLRHIAKEDGLQAYLSRTFWDQ